jgi:predicted kinase
MEKQLILLRGIPGSGKSTFAKLLGRAICTADDYHTDRNGLYNWKQENIGKSHNWCKRKCRRFLKAGIETVIVANTSTTEDEIKPYFEMARDFGYKFFSVIVENRHGNKNDHGVPDATLEKMKNRFSIKLT